MKHPVNSNTWILVFIILLVGLEVLMIAVYQGYKSTCKEFKNDMSQNDIGADEKISAASFTPNDVLSVSGWNKIRQRIAHEHRLMILELESSLPSLNEVEIVFESVPVTYDCDRNTLMRIGGAADNDGGKWICGEYLKKRLSREAPNIVFSIGSRGDFSFEKSMIQYLGSNTRVYTFDCKFQHVLQSLINVLGTGKWKPPSEQITFINECVGSLDYVDSLNRTYKTWATLIAELGIKRIDFLKIDIEGFEWVVLPAILEHKDLDELPVQISFEVHKQAPGGIYDDIQDKSFGQALSRLFLKLDDLGYYVTSNEYNIVSRGCCSEFTVVRPSY